MYKKTREKIKNMHPNMTESDVSNFMIDVFTKYFTQEIGNTKIVEYALKTAREKVHGINDADLQKLLQELGYKI